MLGVGLKVIVLIYDTVCSWSVHSKCYLVYMPGIIHIFITYLPKLVYSYSVTINSPVNLYFVFLLNVMVYDQGRRVGGATEAVASGAAIWGRQPRITQYGIYY